ITEEGENILLQDPELGEAAGRQGAIYAPKVTYAVPCTCRAMTQEQACKLQSVLLSLLESVEKGELGAVAEFEGSKDFVVLK
ncbi:hypothetical protein PFISCL1PPCAC_3984, partial [Pristionchus fissidentatus]